MNVYKINVNMENFRENWEYYQDNVQWGEIIELSKGKIVCISRRNFDTFLRWLNEFDIFYTAAYIEE